ncbi:MAG: 30S ribosomal protein S8 [Acidobacteria bacterium]|nr:30S ribosomal protein S8 [Acidobacteriota bacterium]
MSMTDPIADMLTRIRNANSAQFDSVKMPGSKLKTSLAQILEREGYIAGFSITENAPKPGTTLEVRLKYTADRRRSIAGLKRVSTPGLRIYKKSTEMPKVLGGVGVAVVSTSRGLMTDREARKANLGGEVLCYVW